MISFGPFFSLSVRIRRLQRALPLSNSGGKDDYTSLVPSWTGEECPFIAP
jgi:hypothetical protein